MEESQFERRLGRAACAAWWTVFVGAVWLVAAWLLWLFIGATPALAGFVETLWGGVKLADAKQLVWVFFGAFKLLLFGCIFGAIFLTIWHRKLRKAN